MKFLVIVLIATSIACIQAQDASQSVLPAHLLPSAKQAIASAPAATTPQRVQYAIAHPFGTLANALAFFDPPFASVFHKFAGYDIPLNRQVFVRLLQQALQTGRLDKLNIITILIASLEIPPSGTLQKVALFLVHRFVCNVARSRLLPGIETNLPFIVRSLKANNRISNGVGKTVINGAGSIPIIGNLLKHAGKDIYGTLPGLAEAIRVYADDPVRAVNALTTTLSQQKYPENTCEAVAPPRPVPVPLPHPPIHFGPGPVIPPRPIPFNA